MGIAGDLALIVVAALVGALLARGFRLPVLVGYMVAGVLVGPHTPGPTVAEVRDIELLADIGAALLLFTVGLDFPLSRLAPVRGIALLGTPLQILFTTGLGALVGHLAGWPWVAAAWFGALFAFSSTVTVLKSLLEQGVLNTLASRAMVGILIVQDLAVVPLMVMLPALGEAGNALSSLAWAAGRAGLFVAGMVLFGTRVFPWLTGRIASSNSRELFLVFLVAVGLGVGYVTYLFGLPFAFGAFLAGMVLSGSPYSHQALHDIAPLRDIFGMLFFVSAGMLVDPALFRGVAGLAPLVLLVLLGKVGILAVLTRAFGYGNIAPFAVSLGLFQVGEFSFVLAREGNAAGALPPALYSLVLATAVVTIALTPLATRLAPLAYGWWRRTFQPPPLQTIQLPATGLQDHVVIGGYGRVGSFVARLLHGLGCTFCVIELDPHRVAEAQAAGFPVIYGDVAAEPVLEAAGARQARLFLLTVPDPMAVRLGVVRLRRINPGVHVVARAASEEQLAELRALGVYEAVQPELEAGLELVRQSLAHLGADPGDLERFTEQVHREFYGSPPQQEAAESSASPGFPR